MNGIAHDKYESSLLIDTVCLLIQDSIKLIRIHILTNQYDVTNTFRYGMQNMIKTITMKTHPTCYTREFAISVRVWAQNVGLMDQLKTKATVEIQGYSGIGIGYFRKNKPQEFRPFIKQTIFKSNK